jgi:hypothetical protein
LLVEYFELHSDESKLMVGASKFLPKLLAVCLELAEVLLVVCFETADVLLMVCFELDETLLKVAVVNSKLLVGVGILLLRFWRPKYTLQCMAHSIYSLSQSLF